MGKVKIRYLIAKQQKGHTLYYWQPTKELQALGFLPRRLSDGKNCPLEAANEAELLNAELDDFRAGKATEISLKPGTLKWLIDQYQRDSHFLSLRPATRDGYVYNLAYLERWAGDAPFTKISRVAVRAFLDGFKGKQRTQQYVYQAGRIIYSYAKDLGLIDDNPFEKHRIKTNDPRELRWSEADEKSFLSACKRPSIALAMIIAADTGQRQTDILKMAWTQYDGQYIRLKQSKTGTKVEIPVTDRLKTALYNAAKNKVSTQILVNEGTHKPYKRDTFGHLFKETMTDAGIAYEKQFRDLRRTAVVNLKKAGCDDEEIACITGWSYEYTKKMLDIYLPKDIKFADAAILKVENYRKNPSNSEKGS